MLKHLNGNVFRGRHYVDLIEDYMSMWDIENKYFPFAVDRSIADTNKLLKKLLSFRTLINLVITCI